jgi:regulator of replication initiation timing
MYIYLTEEVLRRTDLSGDEKILLSYIMLLTRHNKTFFASERWTVRNLGFTDLEAKKRKLIERNFCGEMHDGSLYFQCLPEKQAETEKEKPHKPSQRRFSKVRDHLHRLEAEGWMIIMETEGIIQLEKDGQCMNIPKTEVK